MEKDYTFWLQKGPWHLVKNNNFYWISCDNRRLWRLKWVFLSKWRLWLIAQYDLLFWTNTTRYLYLFACSSNCRVACGYSIITLQSQQGLIAQSFRLKLGHMLLDLAPPLDLYKTIMLVMDVLDLNIQVQKLNHISFTWAMSGFVCFVVKGREL